MQHAININAHTQTANTTAPAKAILKKEATQKIIMFTAILICIVAAVNL